MENSQTKTCRLVTNQARTPGLNYFRRGIEPDSGIRGKRMSEVAIYKGPHLSDDKHYVRLGDYAARKAERDALAAENAALRNAHPQPFGPIMMQALDAYQAKEDEIPEQGMMDALFILRDSINIETPATDAYLNSVRADGVEMFGSALKDKYEGIAYELIGNYETNGEEDRISDEGEVQAVFHFANQLRAGEPS
jgi:hypothetical protein